MALYLEFPSSTLHAPHFLLCDTHKWCCSLFYILPGGASQPLPLTTEVCASLAVGSHLRAIFLYPGYTLPMLQSGGGRVVLRVRLVGSSQEGRGGGGATVEEEAEQEELGFGEAELARPAADGHAFAAQALPLTIFSSSSSSSSSLSYFCAAAPLLTATFGLVCCAPAAAPLGLSPGGAVQQQLSLWLRCPASGALGGIPTMYSLYAALCEGSGELAAGPQRLTRGLGAGEGSVGAWLTLPRAAAAALTHPHVLLYLVQEEEEAASDAAGGDSGGTHLTRFPVGPEPGTCVAFAYRDLAGMLGGGSSAILPCPAAEMLLDTCSSSHPGAARAAAEETLALHMGSPPFLPTALGGSPLFRPWPLRHPMSLQAQDASSASWGGSGFASAIPAHLQLLEPPEDLPEDWLWPSIPSGLCLGLLCCAGEAAGGVLALAPPAAGKMHQLQQQEAVPPLYSSLLAAYSCNDTSDIVLGTAQALAGWEASSSTSTSTSTSSSRPGGGGGDSLPLEGFGGVGFFPKEGAAPAPAEEHARVASAACAGPLLATLLRVFIECTGAPPPPPIDGSSSTSSSDAAALACPLPIPQLCATLLAVGRLQGCSTAACLHPAAAAAAAGAGAGAWALASSALVVLLDVLRLRAQRRLARAVPGLLHPAGGKAGEEEEGVEGGVEAAFWCPELPLLPPGPTLTALLFARLGMHSALEAAKAALLPARAAAANGCLIPASLSAALGGSRGSSSASDATALARFSTALGTLRIWVERWASLAFCAARGALEAGGLFGVPVGGVGGGRASGDAQGRRWQQRVQQRCGSGAGGQ